MENGQDKKTLRFWPMETFVGRLYEGKESHLYSVGITDKHGREIHVTEEHQDAMEAERAAENFIHCMKEGLIGPADVDMNLLEEIADGQGYYKRIDISLFERDLNLLDELTEKIQIAGKKGRSLVIRYAISRIYKELSKV